MPLLATWLVGNLNISPLKAKLHVNLPWQERFTYYAHPMEIKKRLLSINLPPTKSAFLWGPRKVGKSTWIRKNMETAVVIDFLKTDVFADYVSRPVLLRERYSDAKGLIVIDEVQKVPDILDEVQWLMDNKNISFLLTGSSARKLRKSHANLLGGRAWGYTMAPLCFPEIRDLDIEAITISGLLPPHLLSVDPIAAKVLRILQEDHTVKRSILVSFESEPKKFDGGIECLPWKMFLEMLWAGQII